MTTVFEKYTGYARCLCMINCFRVSVSRAMYSSSNNTIISAQHELSKRVKMFSFREKLTSRRDLTIENYLHNNSPSSYDNYCYYYRTYNY